MSRCPFTLHLDEVLLTVPDLTSTLSLVPMGRRLALLRNEYSAAITPRSSVHRRGDLHERFLWAEPLRILTLPSPTHTAVSFPGRQHYTPITSTFIATISSSGPRRGGACGRHPRNHTHLDASSSSPAFSELSLTFDPHLTLISLSLSRSAHVQASRATLLETNPIPMHIAFHPYCVN